MDKQMVLVVEDDEDLSEAISDTLNMAGYEVETAIDGQAALALLFEDLQPSLVISDVQMSPMDGHQLLKSIKSSMPELPVLLMTAYGSIPQAVDAMKLGACDYIIKPFQPQVLVHAVSRYARACGHDKHDFVAEDPKSKETLKVATKVANSEATVMITGESGSGKEVMARFLHEQSPRMNQSFVAINCAAIPDNMLESTLFGYEKGAFTGAYQACPGKFEQAQGGTLLLDEISEMDLGLQAKLLRVLQEKEVERLGGKKVVDLDVRVLATSNRNLKKEVELGHFREDLYYRLNVFPIRLHPLRERKKDIPVIAQRLLERSAGKHSHQAPELSPEAVMKLQLYSWPGNVRELDNVIQRALILHSGNQIKAEDIQFETENEHYDVALTEEQNDHSDGLGGDMKLHEQKLIIEALEAGNGSRKEAADRLGISPRTLRYKIAKLREQGVEIPGRALATAE